MSEGKSKKAKAILRKLRSPEAKDLLDRIDQLDFAKKDIAKMKKLGIRFKVRSTKGSSRRYLLRPWTWFR